MKKNKERIKKEIVQFTKREYQKSRIAPSIKQIEKKFNISFQFYFPNSMKELYKLCRFKFSPKQNRRKSLRKWWNKIRESKRKEIIDFVKKEYRKSGIVPSAREIDKKLNVSFRSCFPKGMNILYKLCGLRFSPEENKRKSRKEFYLKKQNKIKKEILKYFIQQIKKGVNPTTTSIREKFPVSLLTYFHRGIRELYKIAKANPPAPLRDREELRKEIIKYIQSQVKKRFYPTYQEIEEKFQTNIRNYLSIRRLYELAKVEYKRDPNPFLRYKKEKKLVDIVLKLFPKLGYKIKSVSIGPSMPNGADIIIEDKRKRIVPIEIKAYQKFGKIGQTENSPYIRNELFQLKRYIKNLRSPYGYLITSTDRKTFKTLPSNVKILFGKDLKRLLIRYKMYNELKNLDWIRNSSISYGKEKIYKKIQNKILKYTAEKWKKRKYVSRREIFKKFKVNPDSYFPGGTTGIYKKLNINPELISNYRMSRNFNKEKFKKGIIDFVKEENKKGRFPTYKGIQGKFRCLPKLFFSGGIREIAKLARIKYNRKFASKTPEEKEFIKQKIIEYTKKKLQKGYYPGYQDFKKDLLIGPLNYFNGIGEIYRKSGYIGLVKKTWKNSGRKLTFPNFIK